MIHADESVVVRTTARFLVPFLQVFALYVIVHGHESPGGGFQGGAILGASLILTRLSQGRGIRRPFPSGDGPIRLGAFGVLLYGSIGLLPVLRGAPFLDYARLPWFAAHEPELRALGILGVEIGVAAAVCGVMVSIFEDLAPKET
ncbi:MAG: hypothetical protein KatS3mg076_1745 [Candidatus Binatia bacterium]|nr:MAG: hypothetical protein KatS3mg076_1745 [Candidatus Binatia bacterium]